MQTTSVVLAISALLCLVMLLILWPINRSGVLGAKAWTTGNILGILAFVLYALGRDLPPLIAYELANGVNATAMSAVLVGYLQFFGRAVPWKRLGAAIAFFTAGIAYFHYLFDSFAMRTLMVALFQAGACLAIGWVAFKADSRQGARYPFRFIVFTAGAIAVGHLTRGLMYLFKTGELTSLLQPAPWNLFFLAANTLVFPALTFGAVLLVYEIRLANAESAANRDFLTGAWSRRAFIDIAHRELSWARREKESLVLLLVDIDNFKLINDSLGHAAGDFILKDLTQRARKAVRDTDYLARLGGDEFAVLLPQTEQPAALAVAERLREILDTHASTAGKNGPRHGVDYTVSVGLAVLHNDESFEELTFRADAALYQSKNAGRNRVVCAGHPGAEIPRHGPSSVHVA